jgi:hypothetical protein
MGREAWSAERVGWCVKWNSLWCYTTLPSYNFIEWMISMIVTVCLWRHSNIVRIRSDLLIYFIYSGVRHLTKFLISQGKVKSSLSNNIIFGSWLQNFVFRLSRVQYFSLKSSNQRFLYTVVLHNQVVNFF